MAGLRIEILEGGAPAAAIAIRTRVFMEEQGVSEREEMDGLDSDCIHFVAYQHDTAVGCARLRSLGDARAKVERVAVLPELRAKGLGREIMDAVEAEAVRRGQRDLVLHAQTSVVDFYGRLGWRAFGPEFDEAGIAHMAMRRQVG